MSGMEPISTGGIVGMHMMNNPMIVLNSPETIIEYLDRRSVNTASRPRNPLVELYASLFPPRRTNVEPLCCSLGEDHSFALMPYGPGWRAHRRVLWQYFHPVAATKHRETQQKMTYALLNKLRESPERMEEHVQ